MSVQAISWVLDRSEARLGARLVMLSIANHADARGENAWPSISTIAAEARLSERQVQRALTELERIGELWIDRNAGFRGTHLYRIVPMREPVLDLLGGDNMTPPTNPQGVTNRTRGGDKSGKGGVTNRAKNMSEMSPEPSYNRQEEPSREPSLVPAAKNRRRSVAKNGRDPTHGSLVWQAYAMAYQDRYGVEPVRNAKSNAQCAQLVKRLGEAEASQVAGWYPTHAGRLYVGSRHCLDLLVRDAEGLRTEWATGRMVTTAEARESDGLAKRGQMWRELKQEMQA